MGRALRGVLTGVGCIAVVGIVLVIAVIIVAVVSIGGGEQSQTQDQEGAGGGEQTVAVSEPLTVGETAWLVTNVEQTSELTNDLGDTETGNFIVVDFEFTNNSSDAVTLDSTMIKVRDSQDRVNESDPDKTLFIPEDRDIFLEQVNPGVTEEGTVIFTVADDASDFIMEVSGGFISGEAGFVDLGI